MNIRPALPEDAAPICHLLRHSITALCVEDHKNDPVILQRWLRNKTPEKFVERINDPHSTMLVAEEGDILLAVGAITSDGEITLNYVSPNARFQGLSRAMISALEKRAKENGCKTCTLNSTSTARRFYLSCGYSEKQPQTGIFGSIVFPMEKNL